MCREIAGFQPVSYPGGVTGQVVSGKLASLAAGA
jgi:hypothetical protein